MTSNTKKIYRVENTFFKSWLPNGISHTVFLSDLIRLAGTWEGVPRDGFSNTFLTLVVIKAAIGKHYYYSYQRLPDAIDHLVNEVSDFSRKC